MSIKIKLIIFIAFSLVVTTTIGFIVFQNATSAKKEVEKQAIVAEILKRVSEQAVLNDEYLLYREERPIIQLQAGSEAINKLLIQAPSVLTLADEQVLISRLGDNNKSADQILSQIATNFKTEGSSPSVNVKEVEQSLISQLRIQSQESIVIVSQLSNSSRNRVIESQNKTTILVLVFFISSTVILILTLLFIWLSIVKPLTTLKEAAVRIASLDFTTTTTTTTTTNSNDEIGQLARAFNRMVGRLKEFYATLEQKVQEQTEKIRKNQKQIEDQQKVTLNVLEELKKEKRSSDRMAAIVNDSDDAIIGKTTDGIITEWNEGAHKLYGFTATEILGKSIKTIAPSDKFKEIDYFLAKVKKGDRIEHFQTKRKKKNGEIIYVSITASPIKGTRGEIVGVSTITRDNSKEKEIDKAKTEFVSLASHQLRTPLSAINWYTEMLVAGDAGKINDKQKQYLDEIYKGNKRMVELVNALLNVSRLEMGTFGIEPKPTNIIDISESVLNELKVLTKKKSLKLEKFYTPDLPLVNADPKLARIVLQNLLSNAVKYTPEKGKVKLSVNKEGEDILIKVSDTGYGIPKNQQKQIFTKLFRADNVREKDTEGTGLGLYLVQNIIEKTGGKVWFESKEGKGTTFFVQLPLAGMKPKKGTKGFESSTY